MTLEEKNGRITQGGFVKVFGSGLTVDGPLGALTFKHIGGTEAFNIDISKLLDNNPTQLLFRLPEDAILGPCLLTITTHYARSGKELKTPHSFTFDVVLTVVAPPLSRRETLPNA